MLPRGPAVTGGDHSSCGRFLSGPLIDLFVSVNHRAAARFQTGLVSLPLVLEREIYFRREREIALPDGEGILIVTRGTSRDTFHSFDDGLWLCIGGCSAIRSVCFECVTREIR